MLFFVFVFFVLVLFLFNCFISNVVFWWSVFLVMTLVFLFLNKSSSSSMLNYFIVQELSGLVFLIFNYSVIQFFIILFKVGASPFHFWIFSVFNNLGGFNVVWFLTFQKLPFIPVLCSMFSYLYYYVFIVGIFFCYLQIFSIKSFKSMILISSTESFNWLLFIMFGSFMSCFFFFIYYFLVLFFVIDYGSSKSIDYSNWECILIFMNFPLTITFFVKIFSIISFVSFSSFFILFLLFFMFLSIFSFGFWLINVGAKFSYYGGSNFNFIYFVIFPLMFICLF